MMTFCAFDKCRMLRNIMGWGGVGMMTCCALDNMSDATQDHWLWWGGVGMMTFCALDHMSDAWQDHGLGWGGDDE